MAKQKKSKKSSVNKFLFDWKGPLGLPQFGKIKDSDFEPAFDFAMKIGLAEINAIAKNKAKPSFENTIVAMEMSGRALNKLAAIFWNRSGAHTNKVIQKLEREISPKLSRYSSKISMKTRPMILRLFSGSLSPTNACRKRCSASTRITRMPILSAKTCIT